MKLFRWRKEPRFFIVNPNTDRRGEVRFESRESVVVRMLSTGKSLPGVAFDIGQKGLKLHLPDMPLPESGVQIQFPNFAENIQCFGHIIWTHPVEGQDIFEAGFVVESWLGIVEGGNSWKKLIGFKIKKDRRNQNR